MPNSPDVLPESRPYGAIVNKGQFIAALQQCARGGGLVPRDSHIIFPAEGWNQSGPHMSGNERRTGLQNKQILELIMSNINASAVDGYNVEAPIEHKQTAPKFSLSALFERLSDRMYTAERKEREGQVARFIRENGGVLTDDLERRISRDFGRIVE